MEQSIGVSGIFHPGQLIAGIVVEEVVESGTPQPEDVTVLVIAQVTGVEIASGAGVVGIGQAVEGIVGVAVGLIVLRYTRTTMESRDYFVTRARGKVGQELNLRTN